MVATRLTVGLVAVWVASVAVAGTCPFSQKAKAAAEDECAVCVPAPVGEKTVAAKTEDKIGKLDTGALAALLKAKAPVVLLDARSGKGDDGKRIPGARTLTSKSTPKEIAAALPSKDALIVTYCTNTKCGASPRLAKKLVGLGYTNVLEYPKGIQGWAKAGQTVQKTK